MKHGWMIYLLFTCYRKSYGNEQNIHWCKVNMVAQYILFKLMFVNIFFIIRPFEKSKGYGIFEKIMKKNVYYSLYRQGVELFKTQWFFSLDCEWVRYHWNCEKLAAFSLTLWIVLPVIVKSGIAYFQHFHLNKSKLDH